MLSKKDFSKLISIAPLISIDLLIINEKKIILGKRMNKPAQFYWFTPGGRIYKNELISVSIKRIFYSELSIKIINEVNVELIGVFEHFYPDSFCDVNISTHYVNIPYLIKANSLPLIKLKKNNQHSELRWWSFDEAINSSSVHHYAKKYIEILNEREN